MKDEELREKLNKYGEENELTFVLLDSPFFDRSIVAISGDKLVYDYNKMVEEFMEDNTCSEEEAIEFIEYNTMRALPYFENHPIIIDTDELQRIREWY